MAPNKEDPLNWGYKYGNKQRRENYLNTVEFKGNRWIPCSISIFPAVWQKYREDLKDIAMEHPFIFGTFIKHKKNFDKIPDWHVKGSYHLDNWGCKWYVAKGGFEGQIIENPLDDWEKFDTYKMPDPIKLKDTSKIHRGEWWGMKRAFKIGKKLGIHTSGPGGKLFDE